MIARLWHGKVPSEKAADYYRYLQETGLKDYAAVAGNRGIFLLKKEDKEATHFYTLTFWENTEAVKAFAGEAMEQARYYPEDAAYLLEPEPTVTHFDVLEYRFRDEKQTA